MANPTTLNGYNTQLDIKSLVSSMVAAERAPKESQLTRLEKTTTAKISGVGQLKNAIADLQTALKDLNKPELYQSRTAASSDTKLLTATATKSAMAGVYSVEIGKLATASKVATAPVADGADHVFASGGSLTVSLGSNSLREIDVKPNATLKDVRDAINTQLKNDGVSANIITDPKSGESRLVLSSSKTGAGNDLTVSVTGASLQGLAIPPKGTPGGDVSYLSMAEDAEFSIDGLQMTSATNNVENVIDGVTLALTSVTEANKPITLTVEQDKTAVSASVKKFVDAYDKLINVTNSLTSVTSVGEDKAPVTGALVGDATVRSLLTSVRGELGKVSGGGDVRLLADLGISTQKDGTLKIDDKKLDKILTDNFESVSGFFTGDSGLMSRLDERLTPYTQTGGTLQQRTDGLQGTMTSVSKQRVDLNLRMDKLEARLLKQFNAMDSLVGQLNQTSSRLSQTLASLPGVVK